MTGIRVYKFSEISTQTHTVGNKQYELTNHLGNVLTVVSDKRTVVNDTTSIATVNSSTDYWAFGSILEGRSYESQTLKWGFNGKLNENEPYAKTGTLQDYGMRYYLTELGRFLIVDPLYKKYPWNATYAFAEGSPIKYVDLDGMEKSTVSLIPLPLIKMFTAAAVETMRNVKKALKAMDTENNYGTLSDGWTKGEAAKGAKLLTKGVGAVGKVMTGVGTIAAPFPLVGAGLVAGGEILSTGAGGAEAAIDYATGDKSKAAVDAGFTAVGVVVGPLLPKNTVVKGAVSLGLDEAKQKVSETLPKPKKNTNSGSGGNQSSGSGSGASEKQTSDPVER